MEAKKHPALAAALVALALVALTGVALTAVEISKFNAAAKTLHAKDAEGDRLLTKEKVALTKDNVDVAKATLAKFDAAEAEHRAILAGSPAARFDAEFKGEPGELGSEIKGSVERWQRDLKAAGIPIVAAKPDDFAFGFSRYYQQGTNPQKALSTVYRQTKVIDFIIKTLVDSKLKDDVRLLAVEREPLELPGVTAGNFLKDETPPARDTVLRQDGLLRTETYRVRFTARTDVVRRLINAVTDARRPLCVRGLEIAPATKEQLADAKTTPGGDFAGIFAGAGDLASGEPTKSAAADAKPEVVVPAAPSDVTVTFAYLEPVKVEPATPPASTL